MYSLPSWDSKYFWVQSLSISASTERERYKKLHCKFEIWSKCLTNLTIIAWSPILDSRKTGRYQRFAIFDITMGIKHIHWSIMEQMSTCCNKRIEINGHFHPIAMKIIKHKTFCMHINCPDSAQASSKLYELHIYNYTVYIAYIIFIIKIDI